MFKFLLTKEENKILMQLASKVLKRNYLDDWYWVSDFGRAINCYICNEKFLDTQQKIYDHAQNHLKQSNLVPFL